MITNYQATKMLKSILNFEMYDTKFGNPVSKPGDVYLATAFIGLSTTAPHAAETGGTGATAWTNWGVTEPEDSKYKRVEIHRYTGRSSTAITHQYYFNDPSNGTTDNNKDLIFPRCSESWGTIGYICIWDAQTGGNLIWYGPLTTSGSATTITPVANDIVLISKGDLDLSLI